MTKADIVRQVSENTGIDKKEVGAVIESFMENVRESLCKNENVYRNLLTCAICFTA